LACSTLVVNKTSSATRQYMGSTPSCKIERGFVGEANAGVDLVDADADGVAPRTLFRPARRARISLGDRPRPRFSLTSEDRQTSDLLQYPAY
jgi:hypothetical protein